MGRTKMPCAPSAFRFPIISQKHFHPSVASGMMVGLFTPARTSIISFTLSVGAFISTYFLSSAAFTASIRNKSSSRISFFSGVRLGLPISKASLFITISTSFRLLLIKVDPELTISNMASERPIPGAISTDPVIT